MLSQHDDVYAAQLGFYAAFVLPAAFVMYSHGIDAIHGWFFIFVFCVVRITGAALLLQADQEHTFNEAGTILYNVALAPLIFAISGVCQEASITVAHRHPRLLGTVGMWSIHIAVSGGIALLIAGAVLTIEGAEEGKPVDTYVHLVQAGTAIFLVILVAMTCLAVYSFRQPRQLVSEKRLITMVVAAMPLLTIRVLYSFLGAVINDASWSFLTGGTLAEQLVLDVVPEFLLTLLMVGTGLVTRNIVADRKQLRSRTSGNYALVDPQPKHPESV